MILGVKSEYVHARQVFLVRDTGIASVARAVTIAMRNGEVVFFRKTASIRLPSYFDGRYWSRAAGESGFLFLPAKKVAKAAARCLLLRC
jgi:hypothetical protein